MSAPAASKGSVLVVDDDAVIRELLRRALGGLYTVHEAGDGVEAVEVLRRIPAPNVILCDVMMPRMNGYALGRFLKARAETKAIPIIFLTARGSAMDVVEGINAGARHYITKPFQVKDVLEKIAKIVK